MSPKMMSTVAVIGPGVLKVVIVGPLEVGVVTPTIPGRADTVLTRPPRRENRCLSRVRRVSGRSSTVDP
jgi:hypothetical protein